LHGGVYRVFASSISNGVSGYAELFYGSAYRAPLSNSAIEAVRHLSFLGVSVGSRCDLACGSGKQILADALISPKASFFGIDGTAAHIERAEEMRRRLALKNVEFEHRDLASDAAALSERFDIVTCAGTFSWVARETQENIFEFVRCALKPEGIAAIHYLTLPAATPEVRLQRALLPRVAHLDSLRERLVHAQALVRENAIFDTAGDAKPNSVAQVASKRFDADAKDHRGTPHEFLASPISAFYFREFAAFAVTHGLHVVGDACIPATQPALMPDGPFLRMYEHAKSWEEQQELLDMFGSFAGARYALLSPNKFGHSANLESLRNLHFRLESPNWYGRIGNELILDENKRVDISPAAAAAFDRLLAAYPRTLSWSEAFTEATPAEAWHLLCLGVVAPFANNPLAALCDDGGLRAFALSLVECELGDEVLTSATGGERPRHALIAEVLSFAQRARSRGELVDAAKRAVERASMAQFASREWKDWWPQRDASGRGYEPPQPSAALPEQIIDRLIWLGYLA
jgi:hypothetical protein